MRTLAQQLWERALMGSGPLGDSPYLKALFAIVDAAANGTDADVARAVAKAEELVR